jgi:hypothetical protein
VRQIPPHEPEAGCIGVAELREEIALLERLEPRGATRGRPSLAIPANWLQDPRIGPEDLREDVRILERLTAA